MTNPTEDLFPSRYETARGGFIDSAAAGGAFIECYSHPRTGPDGEELAIDVARFGEPDASRVVLIGSGTHGVEGRCGSGIQRALINDGFFADLEPGVAAVLVHGINPFGFAHNRRVDHNNIDVNRNFVDHDAPHPENADYEDLYEVLNPVELDEGSEWTKALTEYATKSGPIAAYRASVGGQYVHPEGLQFGGTARTWSNEVLAAIWESHLDGAELAVNIDLHTGLGPEGIGNVMQTSNTDEPETELAAQWWGGVMRSARPEGADPITCGLVGLGFDEHVTWARTVSIVLEFGTLDAMEVLGAIRADNWLYGHGDRKSEKGREIGSMMRSAFFVDEPGWREKVTTRGFDVVRSALDGVAGT